MNWRSYLAVIGLAALAAAGATWQVQSWRYQAMLATVTTAHQIKVDAKVGAIQAMKDEASRQLLALQAQQQERAKLLSSLGAKHYKELRRSTLPLNCFNK